MCNADKPVLENALLLIANNEAIREREEMEEREKRLKELAEQKRIQEKKYIWNIYEYFLNGITDKSIRHGSGNVYKPETVRIWRDFGTHLHAYCLMDMSFDDISQPFADKFRLYLENIPVMETTINKYVGCFRKLCRYATIERINTNNLFCPFIQMLEQGRGDIVSNVFQNIFPDKYISEVSKVGLEYLETKIENYLNDNTAMDAIVRYKDTDGKPAFIAIETK